MVFFIVFKKTTGTSTLSLIFYQAFSDDNSEKVRHSTELRFTPESELLQMILEDHTAALYIFSNTFKPT